MTVKIQGTIVSPDYDDDFFNSWIDKGVITPSSRVVAAIESADEPIDLYINSYGGDVFAGGEMMIALLKAQMAGKLHRVEVGSLAASMAANIVAALKANGAKIEAHANSQLLFHGCYTVTEGGAQHHEDVAESLRNINDGVIANLNRVGISDCRAWFAEGREKWLDATDAKEMGLFDEVADAPVDSPLRRETAARLAAFAGKITDRKDYAMELDKAVVPQVDAAENTEAAELAGETPAETETPAEPVSEPEPVSAPAEEPKPEDADPEDAIEKRVEALANERFASLQSKHDKMISYLKADRDAARAELDSVKAELTTLRADAEKLKESHAEEIEDLRVQLARSEANREAVVMTALKPSAVSRFEGDARAHLASLPPNEREAFYLAHKDEIDNPKH